MKIFIPLFILLVVIMACTAPHSDESVSQSTPAKEPPPKTLSADVRLSTTGVVIKNIDSVDFSSVTIKLNLTQWGSDDGRADIRSVLQGKTVTVPYGEFTVGTTRMDPRKTKILTVFIKNGNGSSKLFLCPGSICQPA
jgi:hypothetical protein